MGFRVLQNLGSRHATIVHGIKKLRENLNFEKPISRRVQIPLNTDKPAENAAEYGHLFNIIVQINLTISHVVCFNQNWLIREIKSLISCSKLLAK